MDTLMSSFLVSCGLLDSVIRDNPVAVLMLVDANPAASLRFSSNLSTDMPEGERIRSLRSVCLVVQRVQIRRVRKLGRP